MEWVTWCLNHEMQHSNVAWPELDFHQLLRMAVGGGGMSSWTDPWKARDGRLFDDGKEGMKPSGDSEAIENNPLGMSPINSNGKQ